MHYVAIVEEQDGQFGLVFPDFPGCVAVETTLEAVLAEGRNALGFHCEDMGADELPEPSTVAQIVASGEWEIGQGDQFVLVPLIKPIGKTLRVNLSIDAGALAAIDSEAKARGLTRSAFMVAAALDQVA